MHDRDGRLSSDSLYYRVWDVPDSRADVLVSHGYAEHGGRYDHVARALNEVGCRVWAVDHRGHGHSQGERGDFGTWESVVADFDLLVDAAVAEGGDRPLFLVGHSLGGAIAIAYAEAHQGRLSGLSLSAPAIVFPPEIVALADLAEIPDLPLADVVSSDPEVVRAYKQDPLVHQGPPPAATLRNFGGVQALVDRLAEITIPVQIMHGAGDLIVAPEAYKAVVAGVSSDDVVARLWPALYHEIFNEPTAGAVVGALVSWISARLT
ncbi:MAG: lysophospholipase [Actinomycetota bacterium]|nr:lysophospholipase [Actinomycetota bacterium]